MKVRLKKIQFDYLNYRFSEKQETLRLKLKLVSKENQFVIIEIDKDTADEIHEWASCELQKKGFNSNYELTSEGEILEELIDTFYME